MLPHILPLLAGWLLTSLALWIEHVALSQEPWRLDPPATYRVGVLTILAGYALWAGLESMQARTIEPWIAVIALVVIGPGGGVIVEVLYWWDARKRRQRASAARQGELVGAARGLTQEIIDRGGAHGRDQAGRQN